MREGNHAATHPAASPVVRLVALVSTTSAEIAELRAAVVRLRPAPGQRRFSGAAEQTLPQSDGDPNRIPFAVVRRDNDVNDVNEQASAVARATVGFGVLDSGSARSEFTTDPSETVLLRAFYIEPYWQGHGIGRAACRALDDLVPDVLPWARWVLLTVNEGNEPAIRAYRAAGFRDTGRRYHGGAQGPQLVLVRPVSITPPA